MDCGQNYPRATDGVRSSSSLRAVDLPVVNRQPARRREKGLNMSQFAPPTILVVDDDPVALFLAETTLEGAGYPVLTAGSGPEAILALYKNPNIAVLFTDIKMPTIDGFMLADMAKLRRPDLKVLYATGFAEEVSTQPGFRYGKILDKPYEAQHLCDEVRLLLGTCSPSTPAARVNPSSRPGLY
jgi:CheY-like chemotaxis protein